MKYINAIILSLSYVAFSLSYFSVRAFALSLMLLIGFVLLNNLRLVRVDIYFAFIITAFFGFIVFVSAFNGIYLNYFIKLLAMCFYSLLVVSIVRSTLVDSGQFRGSLNLYILIHSMFFVLQLAVFQAFGHLLDFDSYIREGDSQVLAFSRALDDSFIHIRATGLFSEPSFYAMNVLPVSMLNVVLLKRLNLFSAIGIATSLLCLSVASIVILVLLLPIILLVTSGFWKKLSIIFILLIASILISPDIISFIEQRLGAEADYDAIASRMIVINEFRLRGLYYNLLGNGFLWDERVRLGVTKMVGANVRDSGFYVYTLYTSGVLGLSLLLLLMWCALKKNLLLLYCVACILLFKLHVMTGTFWLLVAFFYLIYQEGIRLRVNQECVNNT